MRLRLASTVLLAALLGVLLVAGGCGSDNSEGESSEGSSENTTPILVGAPLPLTGPYAADGETMKRGLEMAVADINAAGGVSGRQLELDIYDIKDESAEILVAAAQKLNGKDRVSVNVTGYGGMGPDIPAFGKYPQPYLHFDGSQLTVDMVKEAGYKNIFMLGDVEKPYGMLTFDLIANRLGLEFPNNKVAILAADFEWDTGVGEGIAEAAEAAGWEVALFEKFPYGTREWGSMLAKIRDINPAMINVSVMAAPDLKTFMEQFRQQPTQSIVELGYGLSIPEFADIVGDAGIGALGDATNSILPIPENEDFVQRFQDEYGEPPGLSILGTCYDGLMLWAEAANAVGDPDDYAAVCDTMKTLNYVGVNGTYTFNEDYYVPEGNDTLPMHFYQIQNGEPVLIFLSTEQVGEFQMPPWIETSWLKQ